MSTASVEQETHTHTHSYIGHSGPVPMQLQPKLWLSIIPNYRGNRAAPRQPADWLCDPKCRHSHTFHAPSMTRHCGQYYCILYKTSRYTSTWRTQRGARARCTVSTVWVAGADFTLHHVCRGRPYVFTAAPSHYTLSCALCTCENSEEMLNPRQKGRSKDLYSSTRQGNGSRS